MNIFGRKQAAGFDDRTIEAFLSGRYPADHDLAGALDSLKSLANSPAPVPSAALELFLTEGFVPAATVPVANPRPVRSTSRTWTQRSGVAVGSLLLATVGAASANALPTPVQSVVHDVVKTLTPFSVPAGSTQTPTAVEQELLDNHDGSTKEQIVPSNELTRPSNAAGNLDVIDTAESFGTDPQELAVPRPGSRELVEEEQSELETEHEDVIKGSVPAGTARETDDDDNFRETDDDDRDGSQMIAPANRNAPVIEENDDDKLGENGSVPSNSGTLDSNDDSDNVPVVPVPTANVPSVEVPDEESNEPSSDLPDSSDLTPDSDSDNVND